MAFGCSRWTTAGAGIFIAVDHPPPQSVSAGRSASVLASSSSPPCMVNSPIRLAWLLWLSSRPAPDRGLALRMLDGSQYLSDHFTNQIKLLGHPAVLLPSSPSPRSTAYAERFNLHADRNSCIHGSHLPQNRGAAERPSATSSNATMPVDRRKERLPEPRSSSSGVALPRSQSGLACVRQTCDEAKRVRPQFMVSDHGIKLRHQQSTLLL